MAKVIEVLDAIMGSGKSTKVLGATKNTSENPLCKPQDMGV